MSAKARIFRRLLMLGAIGLLSCWPREASAQGGDPLKGCNPDTKIINRKGESAFGGDRDEGYLRLDVHLVCNDTTIFADDVHWDSKKLYAEGNVLVSQPGLRVNASRMEMDRETKLAVFYNAYGTAGGREQPAERDMFGTAEADIMFHADKIERLGPKTYRMTHGAFSTCLQPNPRWQIVGTTGTVVLQDHASMKNVQFQVKGLPVLYIPYMYYPLKKEDRQTGFLIPVYTSSGVRGNSISNAFFWAIDRSQDATFNYDYFTKTGQGAGAQYRYVSAQGSGDGNFYVLDEKERLAADGSIERNAHQSYKFTGYINQPLDSKRRFNLVGRVDYTTDITAQQIYQQNVAAFSQRQRYIDLQVNGWVPLWNASNAPGTISAPKLYIRGLFQRTEVFNGDVASLNGSTPRISVTLYDQPFVRSREACRVDKPNFFCSVYYSGNAEGAYLVTHGFDPNQLTTSVRRFDGSAGITAPLSKLEFLQVKTGVSTQLTEWLDSFDPLTGLPVARPITRSLLRLHAEATGPRLQRVFLTPNSKYASGFLHEIAPAIRVDWLSSFDQEASVIPIDNVDRVVTGTTQVNYSLTNSLLAHMKNPDSRRTILTVTIDQSYYTRAQAGAVDPFNPTASAGNYSPVGLRTSFLPTDHVAATFNLSKNSTAWATRGQAAPDYSYSAGTVIRSDRLDLALNWTRVSYFTAAQGFVTIPDTHTINGTTTVRALDRRLGATYGFNYDVANQKLIQQRVVAYYHSQCCGIAFDYQVYSSLLSTVPKDRRMAITFTLAGIGSFSPPLGAFGR